MSTPAYLMNRSPSPFPFHGLKEDQPSPFPFHGLKEDQLQFFSPHQPSSSLSSPIFFTITQDQTVSQQKAAAKCMVHGGPSDEHHILSSSSSLETTVDDISGHKLSNHKVEDEDEDENKSAPKWMSSKMRLTQKLMRAGCAGTDHHHHHEQAERIVIQKFDHDEDHHHQSNMMIRVCADCSTTRTPLWRSGPQGPKSLCNACGIRQRKARRAMAAANDTILSTATNASTTKIKVQIKEKKSRPSFVPQYNKKPLKLTHHPPRSEGRLTFEDFALNLSKINSSGGFPKDEEDAAILLMALSCGLINS